MTECNAWQCRRSLTPVHNCRCSCGGEFHGVDAPKLDVPERPPASVAVRNYQPRPFGHDVSPQEQWPAVVVIKELLRGWAIKDRLDGLCLCVGLPTVHHAKLLLYRLNYRPADHSMTDWDMIWERYKGDGNESLTAGSARPVPGKFRDTLF